MLSSSHLHVGAYNARALPPRPLRIFSSQKIPLQVPRARCKAVPPETHGCLCHATFLFFFWLFQFYLFMVTQSVLGLAALIVIRLDFCFTNGRLKRTDNLGQRHRCNSSLSDPRPIKDVTIMIHVLLPCMQHSVRVPTGENGEKV